MRKGSHIFLLIIFCLYSFTIKTHYCYYANTGKRFHGDCKEHLHGFNLDKKPAKAFLTDTKYFCLDVHKDFQYKQTETTYKFVSFEIALPHVYITRTPVNFYHRRHWNIKEVPIRAGPAIAANTLRGPPTC